MFYGSCVLSKMNKQLSCVVAIGQVRARLQEAFGEAVQYTVVDGKGTLVQATSAVDAAQFQVLTREAISASQAPSLSQEK
jgi:hypothetical protein